jgi:hypothetical protein
MITNSRPAWQSKTLSQKKDIQLLFNLLIEVWRRDTSQK